MLALAHVLLEFAYYSSRLSSWLLPTQLQTHKLTISIGLPGQVCKHGAKVQTGQISAHLAAYQLVATSSYR